LILRRFSASLRFPGKRSHLLSGSTTFKYLMGVPEAIARGPLGHPHSPPGFPQGWIAKRCGFGTTPFELTPFELARLGTCH